MLVLRDLGLLGILSLTACGGAYIPNRTGNFDAERSAEINDDDVRKAFDARPQLGEKVRVAYFTYDPEKAADVEGMLGGLPGVSSVYRIPPLVVTGERRFQQDDPWRPASEISLKKLRLLAAHAHADVVVVVDHGYRWPGANALAALDVLIVPALFVPFLDNEVESYVDAFVIDTRNGYLYGHATEDEKNGPRFATIYGEGPQAIAQQQWERLRTKIGADLAHVLVEGRKPTNEGGS